MWHLLDWFFVLFHFCLVVFNLFGWIWKKTRLANLITLLLTGASWFILGIFYGIGYCPITDWHWKVLSKLGAHDLPASYIQYLLERFAGIRIPAATVDRWTFILFLLALAISSVLNLMDSRTRRH